MSNYVLIVSKTKMKNDHICVGGIDLDNKLSVRLLNNNGEHELICECPYCIRDVWDIEYIRCPRPLPHSEDVRVVSKNKSGVFCQELSMLGILKQLNFTIYEGNILNAFEGKLRRTHNGSFYISKDLVSNNSTCFWICDSELVRAERFEKIRYNCPSGSIAIPYRYSISYVGLDDNPSQTISKGTLVRLSLAHWWSPQESNNEERCYLQISGWYDR